MASSCRWAVRVSSAGGSSRTSESRQPPDTTGVEGLRTTPFLGWLVIRMRSGWIPTRNVARISVRNCTYISTTNGTPSQSPLGSVRPADPLLPAPTGMGRHEPPSWDRPDPPALDQPLHEE